MKTKIKYYLHAGVVALAATTACISCTDTWDEHYDINYGSVPSQSLWETIQQDSELAPFARVLDACNYDTLLSAQQTYTVWAPKITDAEADAYINQYRLEKSQGKKEEENSVVKQFIKNHVAMYNYQLHSTSADTVEMMNGKRMTLTKSSFNNNVEILANAGKPARNGYLYKLNGKEEFFPNVWERIQADTIGGDNALDSVANFIASYNTYIFDASSSVPGGVVDGQIVYLDSVTYLYNMIFTSFQAHIDREDSVYWALMPTNKVWREKIPQYEQYFVFHNDIVDRDSLQHEQARIGLIYDDFFNMRNKTEAQVQDSICSVNYSRYSYDRQNVFMKPFSGDGIFAGLEQPFEASNGRVYKSNDWRILPEESFLHTSIVQAENPGRYTLGSPNEAAENMIGGVIYASGTKYKVSGSAYLSVQDKRGYRQQKPAVTFEIPSIYSNCAYDIKIVFATPLAMDTLSKDTMPRRVTAYLQYYNSSTATSFKTQQLQTKEICATRMDTLTFTQPEGFTFPISNLGDDTPRVKLYIESAAERTEISSGTISNNLLIDCIIFEPRTAPVNNDEDN